MIEEILNAEGRRLSLTALLQVMTYGGTDIADDIQGLNAGILEFAKRYARRHLGDGLPVVVIPPDSPSDQRLPAIECLGRLECNEPIEPGAGDCSLALIVWFQDRPAMPIDAAVLSKMRSLDWRSNAKNAMNGE